MQQELELEQELKAWCERAQLEFVQEQEQGQGHHTLLLQLHHACLTIWGANQTQTQTQTQAQIRLECAHVVHEMHEMQMQMQMQMKQGATERNEVRKRMWMRPWVLVVWATVNACVRESAFLQEHQQQQQE